MRMKYECRQDGPHSQTQTQAQAQQHHLTTPVIDSNDTNDPTAIRLREINNVECVFGGNLYECQFYYHVFDDIVMKLYDNYFLSPGMLF